MRNFRIMAQEVANLTDARFFASCEVDWLGFNFDPSRLNYISPQKAAAIREWVEGPAITGIFGVCSGEEIAAVRTAVGLDAIMVNIFTDPSDLPGEIPIFAEIVVDAQTDWGAIASLMDQWASRASFFVMDFFRNGICWEEIQSENFFPLSWLSELFARYPILAAIDLKPAELQQMAQRLHPAGFCLRGGEEEKTGFKSFDELEGLLEILEIL
jgi:phosphoribosylanthranilate isomerase